MWSRFLLALFFTLIVTISRAADATISPAPAATPVPSPAPQTSPASATPPLEVKVELSSIATPSPSASPADTASPAATPNLPSDFLAAVKAADFATIVTLLDAAAVNKTAPDEKAVTALLDGLILGREFKPFAVLFNATRTTGAAATWQPDAEMLRGLIKDDRRDFLEFFLACGMEPVHFQDAAAGSDTPTAQWLKGRATEIQQQADNIEALVQASQKGDLDAMRKLLDSGVSVNSVSLHGLTPLGAAAQGDQLAAVQLLLDRKADPNKVADPADGFTPLCLTISVPVAQAIKAAGGDVNAKLYRGNTSILTYVMSFGTPELVAWFLQQGLDPKMLDDHHRNLLFHTVSTKTAEVLLKAGVNPNQTDDQGRTPLNLASNADVARLLIKHGAKVNGLKWPLIFEVEDRPADVLEVVLAAGADQTPPLLQQALLIAITQRRDDVAAVLLRHGAKPNQPIPWPTGKKSTPLMVCCRFGATEIARLLLKAGAEPNAANPSGLLLKTALQNGQNQPTQDNHKGGAKNGSADLAKLLRAAGTTGLSDLAFAAAIDDQAKVKELLSSAPRYEKHASFWDGVLWSAAFTNNVALAKSALDHGVPIKDEEKESIRLAASSHENKEVFNLLFPAHK